MEEGKPRYDLIPTEGLTEVAKLVTLCVERKGEATWRGQDPQNWSEQYNSINRHLNKWWLEQDNDPETGINHLAAVAFRALVVVSQSEFYPEIKKKFDNRPVTRREKGEYDVR